MDSPPIKADNVVSPAKCRLFHFQVKQITFNINGLDAFDRILEGAPTKSAGGISGKTIANHSERLGIAVRAIERANEELTA